MLGRSPYFRKWVNTLDSKLSRDQYSRQWGQYFRQWDSILGSGGSMLASGAAEKTSHLPKSSTCALSLLGDCSVLLNCSVFTCSSVATHRGAFRSRSFHQQTRPVNLRAFKVKVLLIGAMHPDSRAPSFWERCQDSGRGRQPWTGWPLFSGGPSVARGLYVTEPYLIVSCSILAHQT